MVYKLKKGYVSKSFCKTYFKCPLQAKKNFLEKRVRSEPIAPALARGIEFHDQVARWWPHFSMDVMTSFDDPYEYIRPMLPAGRVYDNYVRFEVSRYEFMSDPHAHFQPIYVEKSMFNSNYMISGTIDRLDWIEPGEYYNNNDRKIVLKKPQVCILDFKTGKYNPNYFSDLRFELNFYVWLLNLQTKYKPIYISAYFPDANEMFFDRVNKRSYDTMLNKYNSAKLALEAEHFPKKFGFHCNWCDHAVECLTEDLL